MFTAPIHETRPPLFRFNPELEDKPKTIVRDIASIRQRTPDYARVEEAQRLYVMPI